MPKYYGDLELMEGAKIINLSGPFGPTFPPNGNLCEFFWLTSQQDANAPGLYIHNGSAWHPIAPDVSNIPAMNLMPDSGRFASNNQNPLDLAIYSPMLGVPTFTVSPFLAAANGSAQANAGRFYNNNSTYGGSATALNAVLTSLLTKLGRTGDDARYGAEFFVSQLTAGAAAAGTSPIITPDNIARYLATVNGSRNMFLSKKLCTFVAWVRVVSGSLVINNTMQYKNGVAAAANPITAADGWTHIRVVGYSNRGFNNNFPNLFCSPSAVVQIALPAFYPGFVDVGMHVTPLNSFNGAAT